MAERPLPDEHHFARQCSGVKGLDFSDVEDSYHQPPWLQGRAFQPKEDNPNLSGLWLEREAGSWHEQLNRTRNELQNCKRVVRRNAMLAIVPVALAKDLGRKFDRDLHVLHTPDQESFHPRATTGQTSGRTRTSNGCRSMND